MRLHQRKRCLGWTDEQLHDAIGASSTTLLSSAQASACIRRLGGGELPYPPGRKPTPFAGRRKRTDATQMIADGHIEQITRLLRLYFDDEPTAGLAWLGKDFDAQRPRELLTAKRAGRVIRVLKRMIERRRERDGVAASTCDAREEETSPTGRR